MTDAQLYLWDSTARASSSVCQRWPQLARANCYHLKWFNIIPGNDALRKVDRQYTTQQLERREYTQTSQESAQAEITADQASCTLNLGQFQIVALNHAYAL